MLKKFGLTCLLLTCLGLGSAVANTFDIHFGSLYGSGRDTNPTTIVGGTGELFDELAGGDFYWVCLDQSLDDPKGLHVFNLSTSPEVLTNGFWDSGVERSLQTNAAMILGAVANIYYNYESDILSDFSGYGGGAGYAFQSAVWALTTGFKYNHWDGELTSEKIETIIAWYYPDDPTMDLTRTYLRSALDGEAALGKQVYYGNIKVEEDGDLGIQSVMLFKAADAIPEPSSVLLMLGAAGAIGFLSRRRVKS